jgi:hypothetical protein
LGNAFTWADFPSYFVGSFLGWLWVRWLKRSAKAPSEQSLNGNSRFGYSRTGYSDRSTVVRRVMINWNVLKKRYLRDELPIRLGNLASNLARIKSRCQNAANRELVESLL